MREGEIPVFYREITNEGRQLPPFVCYLLLPRFGGEYGLVNSRSFMSCFFNSVQPYQPFLLTCNPPSDSAAHLYSPLKFP